MELPDPVVAAMLDPVGPEPEDPMECANPGDAVPALEVPAVREVEVVREVEAPAVLEAEDAVPVAAVPEVAAARAAAVETEGAVNETFPRSAIS